MGLDWSHLLVAIVAGLLAALPGLYQTWQSRQKTDAEAQKVDAETAQVLTTVALDMVKKWQCRVECLEDEVESLKQTVSGLTDRVRVLERENDEYARGCSVLANQVMELGDDPAWLPGDTQPPR